MLDLEFGMVIKLVFAVFGADNMINNGFQPVSLLWLVSRKVLFTTTSVYLANSAYDGTYKKVLM
ncbi:MAG: hypothetical protein CM15mP23_09190 [Cryomorphaceae bacterium]|nr:MAG: hypothetical protein CM15mP23_09190 [Cryomorphaceae bacterium]